MPNYVINHICFLDIDEAEKEKILNDIKYDKYEGLENTVGTIDFRKILPIPENIYLGDLGQKEMKLYGKNNWYDWCIENWGTKWNSDPVINLSRLYVSFHSAWNAPVKVIKALSRKYPNVCIKHFYADEDIGYNCGWLEYRDGEIVGGTTNEDMTPEESAAFAKAVWEEM